MHYTNKSHKYEPFGKLAIAGRHDNKIGAVLSTTLQGYVCDETWRECTQSEAMVGVTNQNQNKNKNKTKNTNKKQKQKQKQKRRE